MSKRGRVSGRVPRSSSTRPLRGRPRGCPNPEWSASTRSREKKSTLPRPCLLVDSRVGAGESLSSFALGTVSPGVTVTPGPNGLLGPSRFYRKRWSGRGRGGVGSCQGVRLLSSVGTPGALRSGRLGPPPRNPYGGFDVYPSDSGSLVLLGLQCMLRLKSQRRLLNRYTGTIFLITLVISTVTKMVMDCPEFTDVVLSVSDSGTPRD